MTDGKALCLNMIVKNEQANIERCLGAVADHIACWVIGDTGSTDGTQDFIKSFFAARNLPGELHSFPFRNFEQARNAALDCAGASALTYDYLLFADADMELVVEDQDFRTKLEAPGYRLIQRADSGLTYWNTRLARRDAAVRYHGVTHEYLDVPGGVQELRGVWYKDHASGSNRVDKFQRDIKLLTQALKRDPEDTRYWFYLAQSQRDAGQTAKAAKSYAKRAEMGGWDEEAWYARLQEARCLRALGDDGGFLRQALAAFNQRPQRAEPLYDLARFYRERSMNDASVLFSEAGLALPRPEDMLFLEDFVYTAGLQEEYSIAANYARDPARKDRGYAACNWLALNREISSVSRDLARSNLFFYCDRANTMMPSFAARRVEFAPPDAYRPLNPSIARWRGEIVLAQRTVNYTLTKEGQYLTPVGTPIHTRNFLLKLNDELEIKSAAEILPPADMPKPAWSLVLGFEDMRAFAWRGELWCSASVRELTPEGWCEQVLARIDCDTGGEHRLTDWRVLRPEGPKLHEKNWMPLVDGDRLQFIYLCDPTRVVDEQARTISATIPAIAAEEFRGGSQAIAFDGGWLALIHIAGERNGQRYYQHRFVWLDVAGALHGVSRPFFFHERGVEFAAGLCWHPDTKRLLVSYSVADSEAWIATIDADEVRRIIYDVERLPSGRPGTIERGRLLKGALISDVSCLAAAGHPGSSSTASSVSAPAISGSPAFADDDGGRPVLSSDATIATAAISGLSCSAKTEHPVATNARNSVTTSTATGSSACAGDDKLEYVSADADKEEAKCEGERLEVNSPAVVDSGLATSRGSAITASAALPTRLFTVHGTVLYVDRSGQLRHGPPNNSPLNAGLVADGAHGQIVFDVSGSLQPIVCLSDRCQTVESANTRDGPFAPTVLEVLQLDGGWVGFKAAGIFLCAEGDGRVTFSRTICSEWEKFRLGAPAAERPEPQAPGIAGGVSPASSSAERFLNLAPFLRTADSPQERRALSREFDERITQFLRGDGAALPQIHCFYEVLSDSARHDALIAATASMRAAGHPVRVWSYSPDKLEFLRPHGIELGQAADVVPAGLFKRVVAGSEIRYFSDLFRYAVLYEHGGLWMDGDVILLRPFPFRGDHFFNLQWGSGIKNEHFVCGNVMYAEPHSHHLRNLYEASIERFSAPGGKAFGEIGPKLLSDYLASDAGAGLRDWLFSPMFFNAIDWRELDQFNQPLSQLAEYLNDARVFGIHLWNARNTTVAGSESASLISLLSDPLGSFPSLTTLADRFDTDKNRGTGNRHAYARVYDRLLSPRRFSLRRLMEIGLCRGLAEGNQTTTPSVALWQSYFPFCHVVGIDLTDFSSRNDERFTSFLCDQSKPDELRAVAAKLEPGSLDVIIDDGSHASYDQQLTLRELFPLLAEGGWYFVEDLDWQPPGEDTGKITLTKNLLREIQQLGAAKSIDPLGISEIAPQFADILFFDSHYELERAMLLGGLVAIRKRGGTGAV